MQEIDRIHIRLNNISDLEEKEDVKVDSNRDEDVECEEKEEEEIIRTLKKN